MRSASHRKGQKYRTVVVDHHTGRLVWAAAGRDRKTVLAFFDALGEERCKGIELVSCDMASWISGPVAERCPDAVRCVDPFHVIQLATDALDAVRREVWNRSTPTGKHGTRPRSEGRAVRDLEEPGEPHRPPASEARRDPEDQRPANRALSRWPYLGFDIAVLGVALIAVGDPISIPALLLAYNIGYIANAIPIPGGIGALDAGLTGALVLYGATTTHAVAAVLIYHTIALWIPGAGGLLA